MIFCSKLYRIVDKGIKNFVYLQLYRTGNLMKTAHITLKTITLFALSLLVSAPVVSAQSSDDNIDVVMCAAVMPCTLDGEVLPEFKDGPCADTYEAQCSFAQNTAVEKSERYRIAECRNDIRRMKQRHVRTISSLKRQLIAAKRAAQLR